MLAGEKTSKMIKHYVLRVVFLLFPLLNHVSSSVNKSCELV